jgi:hypothetical protein
MEGRPAALTGVSPWRCHADLFAFSRTQLTRPLSVYVPRDEETAVAPPPGEMKFAADRDTGMTSPPLNHAPRKGAGWR